MSFLRQLQSFRSWRWPVVLASLLFVAGCGPDTQQTAVCRAALRALVAAPVRVLDSAATGPGTAGVRFDFLRVGDPARHSINCRFAGNRTTGDPRALSGVDLDGQTLSPVHLPLLARALGVPLDPTLLAPPALPVVPPGLRLAFFFQTLIDGIAGGAVLALIAIGYTLVYGITGTIQFAYGDLFMIGAYLVITMTVALSGLGLGALPLIVAAVFPLAACLTAGHGWLAWRVAYRPVRQGGRLAPLIAAIGLSIALQNYVFVFQGARDKWLPAIASGRLVLFRAPHFDVAVSYTELVTLAVSLAMAFAVAWLISASRFGRIYRACAEDTKAASLLGVDVDTTVAATFALGAGLAAVAGLVEVVQYGEADFSMGYLVGFKALTAALLGGFGSLPGAFVGSLALGLFESFWESYAGGEWRDVAVFAVLVLVLVLRPRGLLGDPERTLLDRNDEP